MQGMTQDQVREPLEDLAARQALEEPGEDILPGRFGPSLA
jgi:hypothetical protein